jgi:glutaminyl-tRNA synthetase
MEAVNNPEDPHAGTRTVPFSRVLYIEQDDFREDPPKQYFRLSPGREVRLRYGYFIKCTSVVKDEKTGEVVEIPLHLRSGHARRQRAGRAQGEIDHPLGFGRARIDAEVRLYENLFTREDPNETDEGEDFTANLNPRSLEVLRAASWSRALLARAEGEPLSVRAARLLLRRSGHDAEKPVFNRTVALRDTWAKIEKAEKNQQRNRK